MQIDKRQKKEDEQVRRSSFTIAMPWLMASRVFLMWTSRPFR